MRGDGSKGWGGDADAGVECDMDCVSVKMMCWKVAGCARGDGNDEVQTVKDRDMRAKVITFYKPDVVCLVETWLKGDEVTGCYGYHWFGYTVRV